MDKGKWFCWIILLPAWLQAAEITPLRADETLRRLTTEAAVLADPEGKQTLETILSGKAAFTPIRLPFGAGFTRTVHWFRISLQREEGAAKEWLLNASPGYLNDLRCYSPQTGGGFALQQAGNRFPGTERLLDSAFGTSTFKIFLPDDQPQYVYLRLKTHGSSILSLTIGSPEKLAELNSWRKLVMGLLMGCLLMMIASSLAMWFWRRQTTYLFFIGFVIGGLCRLLAIDGWPSQYLFPNSPAIAEQIGPIGVVTTAFFFCNFFMCFAETKRRFPRLHRLFLVLNMLTAATALSIPFDHYVDTAAILLKTLLLSIPFFIFVTWRAMQQGVFGARAMFYGMICSSAVASAVIVSVSGMIQPYIFAFISPNLGQIILSLFLQWGLYQHLRAAEEQRKHAQARAAIAEKQAADEKHLRKEQTTFLTMIAHELKTPLAVIDSAVQTLELQPQPASELVAASYQRIRQSVSHLNSLLENALLGERRDHSPLQPRIEPIELAGLIADVVRRTLPTGRHCRISGSNDCRCQADRTLLTLALSNLLVNAAKYSPADSEIELRFAKDGSGTAIMVGNHYCSRTAPDYEIWFEKYYRQYEQPNIEGMGMGLYLVRKIAETHGGLASGSAKPAGQDWQITLTLWLPDAAEKTPE